MRKVKDVVYDYSDIERKVRKATSNKPVRATSTQMKEIADATFDPSQFPQIMGILWKRLNEPGKYWRHVYKGLIVLEYIILNGSDQVALAARENIFAIQTLKDFRMIDSDDRDQGQHVRQLAAKIVDLLRDDQRLREQRAKYAAARERVHSSAGGGAAMYGGGYNAGYEADRPARTPAAKDDRLGAEEEDRQLQEVLELSKREAEEEQRRRRQREENDPDLQAAIALSKVGGQTDVFSSYQDHTAGGDLVGFDDDDFFAAPPPASAPAPVQDFWGTPAPAVTDPWAQSAPASAPAPAPTTDFWGSSAAPSAPAPPAPAPTTDFWGSSAAPSAQAPPAPAPTTDFWGSSAAPAPTKPAPKIDANRQLAEIARNSARIDEFSGLRSGAPAPAPAPQPPASFSFTTSTPSYSAPAPQPPAPTAAPANPNSNPWDVAPLEAALPTPNTSAQATAPKQTAKPTILDQHKNLVNLDSLLSGPKPSSSGGYNASNPFGLSGATQRTNPFGTTPTSGVPLNQLRSGTPPAQPMMPGAYGQPTAGAYGQPGMGVYGQAAPAPFYATQSGAAAPQQQQQDPFSSTNPFA